MTDIAQQAAIEAMLKGGSDGSPIGCHEDLDTVCGTCKTFPKAWPAHDWNCRTRGKAVSKHTHACAKYREDAEFVAQLLSDGEQKEASQPPSRQRIEAMELPASPHWHYRRVEKMLDRKVSHAITLPPPAATLGEVTGGMVYFLDCERYTKIGHTLESAQARLRSMATGNPFPLSLWGLVKGPVELERRFHARFFKARHRGEWFQFSSFNRITAERLIRLLGGEVYGWLGHD